MCQDINQNRPLCVCYSWTSRTGEQFTRNKPYHRTRQGEAGNSPQACDKAFKALVPREENEGTAIEGCRRSWVYKAGAASHTAGSNQSMRELSEDTPDINRASMGTVVIVAWERRRKRMRRLATNLPKEFVGDESLSQYLG